MLGQKSPPPPADPTAPGHHYAGVSSDDVWHTADYADSWAKLHVDLSRFHGTMILIWRM
ncbi:MAG: hypothetical protein P8189_09710 [Anaerolineae bacterium]